MKSTHVFQGQEMSPETSRRLVKNIDLHLMPVHAFPFQYQTVQIKPCQLLCMVYGIQFLDSRSLNKTNL
jgi:hypothetical protein